MQIYSTEYMLKIAEMCGLKKIENSLGDEFFAKKQMRICDSWRDLRHVDAKIYLNVPPVIYTLVY